MVVRNNSWDDPQHAPFANISMVFKSHNLPCHVFVTVPKNIRLKYVKFVGKLSNYSFCVCFYMFLWFFFCLYARFKFIPILLFYQIELKQDLKSCLHLNPQPTQALQPKGNIAHPYVVWRSTISMPRRNTMWCLVVCVVANCRRRHPPKDMKNLHESNGFLLG